MLTQFAQLVSRGVLRVIGGRLRHQGFRHDDRQTAGGTATATRRRGRNAQCTNVAVTTTADECQSNTALRRTATLAVWSKGEETRCANGRGRGQIHAKKRSARRTIEPKDGQANDGCASPETVSAPSLRSVPPLLSLSAHARLSRSVVCQPSRWMKQTGRIRERRTWREQWEGQRWPPLAAPRRAHSSPSAFPSEPEPGSLPFSFCWLFAGCRA
jgi:hypothetical protein